MISDIVEEYKLGARVGRKPNAKKPHVRLRMIECYGLRAKGFSVVEVADMLLISVATVKRWCAFVRSERARKLSR